MKLLDIVKQMFAKQQKPNLEILALKERVRAVDVSLANTGIQGAIENALAKWVASYHEKKDTRYSFTDCYGRAGGIPDTIPYRGAVLTPDEILAHVKARDETGRSLMETLYAARETGDEFMRFSKVREGVAGSVSDHDDPERAIMYFGLNVITNRQFLQQFIDMDPNAIMYCVGWVDEIKSLYCAAPSLVDANE